MNEDNIQPNILENLSTKELLINIKILMKEMKVFQFKYLIRNYNNLKKILNF